MASCCLCGKKWDEWSESALCPACGSGPQAREMALFFLRLLRFREGTKVLEVGPSKGNVAYLIQEKFIGKAKYTAIDTERYAYYEQLSLPHRYLQMDATRLSFSDQCFDVILCNGVLPFIRSDYQAMSEFHRCLKSSGIAILDVDVTLPKTKKASEMHEAEPEKYSRAFLHEHGTEWVYGEDYFERLVAAGFFAHRLPVKEFVPESFIEEYGLRPQGEHILCFKYKEEKEKFLDYVAEVMAETHS